MNRPKPSPAVAISIAALIAATTGVAIGSSTDVRPAVTQRAAKLTIARVVMRFEVPSGVVTELTDVPCPSGYRATGGAVSPGANTIAVDGPMSSGRGWTGAVANESSFTATWSIRVICVKGGNKYLRVAAGPFQVSRAEAEKLRAEAAAKLKE